MSVYATIYFYGDKDQGKSMKMIKRETNLDVMKFAKEEMKAKSYKRAEIQWCNLNTNPVTIESQCSNKNLKEED